MWLRLRARCCYLLSTSNSSNSLAPIRQRSNTAKSFHSIGAISRALHHRQSQARHRAAIASRYQSTSLLQQPSSHISYHTLNAVQLESSMPLDRSFMDSHPQACVRPCIVRSSPRFDLRATTAVRRSCSSLRSSLCIGKLVYVRSSSFGSWIPFAIVTHYHQLRRMRLRCNHRSGPNGASTRLRPACVLSSTLRPTQTALHHSQRWHLTSTVSGEHLPTQESRLTSRVSYL